jgi:sec-independent protein translocase protein TatA
LFKGIGTTELIIIFVILLILFGGRKLPELGKGIGDAIKEFKKSVKSKE